MSRQNVNETTNGFMQDWLKKRQEKKQEDLKNIFQHSSESISKRMQNVKKLFELIWGEMYRNYKQLYLHDEKTLETINNKVLSHIENKIQIKDGIQTINFGNVEIIGNDVDTYNKYFHDSKKMFHNAVEEITKELKQFADIAASGNINETDTNNYNYGFIVEQKI